MPISSKALYAFSTGPRPCFNVAFIAANASILSSIAFIASDHAAHVGKIGLKSHLYCALISARLRVSGFRPVAAVAVESVIMARKLPTTKRWIMPGDVAYKL